MLRDASAEGALARAVVPPIQEIEQDDCAKTREELEPHAEFQSESARSRTAEWKFSKRAWTQQTFKNNRRKAATKRTPFAEAEVAARTLRPQKLLCIFLDSRNSRRAL